MMRYFFIVTCFILLAAYPVCSQTRTKPKDAPRKEKHRNVTDELDQRQGVWKFYNTAHQLTREIEYVNNIRDGVSRLFYSNGKVMEETAYKYGLKEGTYKAYYFNGAVKTEGTYMAGKKSEHWTVFYIDGQPSSEGEYIRGNKEGTWKYYDRKGELTYTTTYKGGRDLKEIIEAEKKATAARKAAEEKAKKSGPKLQPRKPSSAPTRSAAGDTLRK